VCERCLQAANPFVASSVDWALPASLLLFAAALLLVAHMSLAAVRVQRSRRRTMELAAAVRARATSVLLHGTPVLLVDDPSPLAFTLPARHGGIVLSRSVVKRLNDEELSSILAHETAHLEQKHHLIGQLLDAVASPLRWVPLISALAEIMAECMEVAADDSARKRAGTRALASALLKLGAPVVPAAGDKALAPAAILNAAGPGRIAHLVSPGDPSLPRWPAWTLAGCLAVLGLAATAVAGPYLGLLVNGCL